MSTVTTPAAQNTDRIHGQAMLVNLNISCWTARKIDKRAANQVAAANNVQSNSGSYYKSLVEGGALEEIKGVATKARTLHYRYTLPWSDAGPRILSNVAYLEYIQEMGKLGQEFDAAVQKFLVEYPLLRQEAKRLLGNLFDQDDYPDLQQVADKFRFRTAVMPLPMGEDFRCDLGKEEVERIRQEITASTTSAVQTAVADAYQRVAKVVGAYIDRLADEDTIFKNSLVENARDLADVLPALNITNDPALVALHQSLKDKLCAHEPDVLRHNKTVRREAYEAAVSMKADLMGFFGG